MSILQLVGSAQTIAERDIITTENQPSKAELKKEWFLFHVPISTIL